MADITSLTKNVLDREQANFKEVIAEFEEKIKADTEKAKAKLSQEFASRQANIEKDLQRQLDISINSIDLRRRDKELAAKRELINQYVTDVETSLNGLDQQQSQQLIRGILAQFPAGQGVELILGSQTKEVLGDLFYEITQGYQVSQDTIPNEAGLIIQKDSIQYNYLFSNLVRDIKPQLEQLIVRNIINN